MTNLVEIDLAPRRRADAPGSQADSNRLPDPGPSRGDAPRAKLYTFNVRQPIPAIPIPLLPEDAEPELDLGAVLHALYDRARFDLRLNYAKPPVPPLSEADAAWARSIAEPKITG